MSDETRTGQSAITCGRCDHPMHWKVCGADCDCRNDVTTIRVKEDVASLGPFVARATGEDDPVSEMTGFALRAFQGSQGELPAPCPRETMRGQGLR